MEGQGHSPPAQQGGDQSNGHPSLTPLCPLIPGPGLPRVSQQEPAMEGILPGTELGGGQ